jgi:hypothetical protein
MGLVWKDRSMLGGGGGWWWWWLVDGGGGGWSSVDGVLSICNLFFFTHKGGFGYWLRWVQQERERSLGISGEWVSLLVRVNGIFFPCFNFRNWERVHNAWCG